MKILIIFFLLTAIGCQPFQEIDSEDKNYWRRIGSETLDSILDRKQNEGIAKNVIVFIGDGMGISTVTMARIYQGQTRKEKGENNVLTFEKFPAVGLSKTYDVTFQVPDSASTATAIFSGVKIKQSVLGLDSVAIYNRCDPAANEMAKIYGAMTWAQEKGKDTGIVTTTRITHATPASTYAHINNRDWECDGEVPAADAECVKDIARQLVEDSPGKGFKVILGGGRRQFGIEDELPDNSCLRKDGRNLVKAWEKNKTNARYVSTADELASVDVEKTDYLLGLFAPSHLSFAAENVTTRPSLKLMTQTAIRMLEKNPNGYALLVEGGRIDQAHHKNYARLALSETVEFDESIAAAVEMTNPEDTLIIVTADHSHSVVMNGYPKRGNDILGLAENADKSFFETITYTNGPGYEYHHPVNRAENCRGNCSEVERQSMNSVRDLRNDSSRREDIFYRHHAAFYRKDETHGGEDVAVYALGPMSHLLVGVYEQNYIANVISYASCIGPESDRCKNRKNSASSSFPSTTVPSFARFLVLTIAIPVLYDRFINLSLKF